MSEIEDDLRATAEAIKADTLKVHDIEEQKAELDPDDPQAAELADEAVDVAERVLQEAKIERALTAEQAAEVGDAGAAG